MLGLAKYRKDLGNSFVKEQNWEAALLCYVNGLYLLNYAHLTKGTEAAASGVLERARLCILV